MTSLLNTRSPMFGQLEEKKNKQTNIEILSCLTTEATRPRWKSSTYWWFSRGCKRGLTHEECLQAACTNTMSQVLGSLQKPDRDSIGGHRSPGFGTACGIVTQNEYFTVWLSSPDIGVIMCLKIVLTSLWQRHTGSRWCYCCVPSICRVSSVQRWQQIRAICQLYC